MTEETKSIHFSEEIFIEKFFSHLNRQGPGSDRITRIAAELLPVFDINAHLADIQCGTGAQTLVLQNTLRRHITAIDSRITMISALQHTINQDPLLTNNISTLVSDPDNLPFPDNYLDLIWSENFIGPYGVDRILPLWNNWLRPGGYLVVSLCSFVRPDPPADEYLNSRFSYMRQITENLTRFNELGYQPLAHIIQPDDCWTDNHYIPLLMKIQEISAAQREDPIIKDFIEKRSREIQTYVKFKSYFRNVTYVLQKTACAAPPASAANNDTSDNDAPTDTQA